MIDFTAIDFEKLNDSQTSVCEVGLVSFVNGMPELFELNSYIRPKENIERNEFAKRALTHIKDEDLLKAPTFEELYPEMKEFIGNNVLVCFNKGADLNYIYRCEKKWNLKGLYSHGYIDVKDVAEKNGYSTNLVDCYRQLFGDIPGNHHHASSDAMACGKVLVEIAKRKQLCLNDYIVDHYIPYEEKHSGSSHFRDTAVVTIDGLLISDDAIDNDINFFANRKVVISGNPEADRPAMGETITKVGGKYYKKQDDYSKVDVLIVGDKVGPSKKKKVIEIQSKDPSKLIVITAKKFTKMKAESERKHKAPTYRELYEYCTKKMLSPYDNPKNCFFGLPSVMIQTHGCDLQEGQQISYSPKGFGWYLVAANGFCMEHGKYRDVELRLLNPDDVPSNIWEKIFEYLNTNLVTFLCAINLTGREETIIATPSDYYDDLLKPIISA